ncbi:MAG: hypothetical protein JWM68_5315 [Verrucomicrobiales bacterium]|nr:hypothetical protein [Verrucomicrobiales bacterium]
MKCLHASVVSPSRLAVHRIFALFLAIIFSLSTHRVRANVYATHIRLQNTTNSPFVGQGDALAVSYILNEPASDGTVLEISAGTNVVRTLETFSGNGTLPGQNSVVWDGKDEFGENVPPGLYSVRITAKSVGYLDWTQITQDSNPGNYVYEPRGIAVNCNSNSPYYGRVFVGNSFANPGSLSAPGDRVGILKLNADASPADEGEFSDGGYPWAGDRFSPWKIEVSDDEKIYVNDWTGLNAAGVIIAFDQTVSTNYQIILDSSNWPPVGLNPTNGATNFANLGGPAITGIGTNTQIWMADISWDSDTNIAKGVGIRRWNVTTNGTVANGDLGTTIVQAGGDEPYRSDINLYPYDLSIDKNGKIYVIQYRAVPADTANKVFRFPAYDESGNPQLVAEWKVGGSEYLVGAFGIAVNRSATLVAVALREGGSVVVLDAETGTNVTTITVDLGHDRRDVAWDNVGNLYSVDNFGSIWRTFSPPGTNQATTPALQNIRVIEKPVLSAPLLDGSQFQCLLSGETNFNYIIQSSGDLSTWTPVSTNFLSNPTQPISVDAASSEQFYRALLAP